MCDEAKIREAFDELEEEMITGRKLIEETRFADVKGYMANTKEGLQKSMPSLSSVVNLNGMRIRIKKTKVMKVTTRVTILEQTKLNITLKNKNLK